MIILHREILKPLFSELGFSEVYEVALGADIGAIAEAHHYVDKVVTGELPFLLTSCCPSWSVMAKKFFPDLIDQISQELTPMVATARTIKQKHPECKSGLYRAMCREETGSVKKKRAK